MAYSLRQGIKLLTLTSVVCFSALAQTLTPATLAFTSTPGVASAPQLATLSNTTLLPVTVTTVSISGPNNADFATTADGTCSAPGLLAAGSSCTVGVIFTPSTSTTESATLTVNAGTPLTVALTGNTPATDTLSAASVAFGTIPVNTTSTAQSVTVTNSGSTPLTITSIALGGTNLHQFTTSNTCAATLAPAATCTISATFVPTATGAKSATITLTDSAADSPSVITLTGTAAPAAVSGASLAPTSLTFAATNVGTTTAPQTITLTNTGTAPLNIASVAFSGPNATDFNDAANTCVGSIPAAGTCTIPVTFTPAAAGSRTATLTVNDDAGGVAGSTQTAALSGTGVGVPAASLSPTSLTFSTTNIGSTSAVQTITLTNTGTGPLTVTNIAPGGTNAGDFAETNTCSSIAVNGTCSISVTFSPTAVGARSGTIVVTDNAPTTTQTATLSGTGAGVASVTLAPTSLSFSPTNINTAAPPQNISISNAGTGPLAIASIAISGTNAADFAISSNSCGTNLAVSASCTVTITFTPSGSGARSATLVVTDSAGNSPQQAALSGSGVAVPTASVSPSSLGFGSANIGTTSAAQTVTVTNTGTGTLNISGAALAGNNPSDFAVSSNTCGATLAVGISCTISVVFRPTVSGSRTATLLLNDNAANTPQTVSLSGVGIGVAGAALSPASINFPNTNINGASPPVFVTLTNPGTGTLTIAGFSVTGTNPADFSIISGCPGTLAAGASCNISVTFNPTGANARSATFVATDNAGNLSGSTQTVALSGTGIPVPGVSYSPTSLNLGSSNTGVTTAAQPITLTNNGTGPLTLSGISLGGANAGDFAIAGNNCGALPATLPASGSCSVSISFDPTQVGNRSATLIVTDNAGNVNGSQQFIAVSGTGNAVPTASVTPTSIGFGTNSAPQPVTLTNTGTGTLTISGIAIGGANAANFGISVNSCGNTLGAGSSCTLLISYTPVASGSSSATLTFTDNSSTGGSQVVSLSGQSLLSIQNSTLKSGTIGSFYIDAVVPKGGISPYSFAITSGSLPAGVSLNTVTGIISGTPAATANSSQLTVKVTDSSSPAQTASQTYTVAIALVIQTPSLSSGGVGTPYTTTIGVQGGSLPYHFAVSSGALPSWATLNSATGTISGTPTTAGTSQFSIAVSDSSSPGQTASHPYSVVIAPGPLTLSTASLPNATTGVGYSATLAATGGTGPYSWSIAGGSLPTGLALNGTTGAITGTPTATSASTSTFTVKVSDAASQSVSRQLSIAISIGLGITTQNLASGMVGIAYSATLGATNGTPPYVWSVTGLPAGLTLDSATGVVGGTPTASGNSSFVVTVTDHSSPVQTSSKTLSLFVAPTTGGSSPVYKVTGLSGAVPPGTNITTATLSVTPATAVAASVSLSLAFTPNSSVTGLPAGYQGDTGFVSNTGTKSTTSTVTIPASTTTVPIPTLDPGTVAGSIVVGGADVTPATITIEPAAPIIEPGSIQITNITGTGFDVELVATSTTRDLSSALFTFSPSATGQLSGTSTFTVDVTSLFNGTNGWFASTSGLTYGGAFSLTIPFTLTGSSTAIGSVSVTLTNSVGTSATASGVF